MENTKHLWRAGILLLLLLIGGLVARHLLVPESFGEMGYYRYAALFEFMEREPRHGSPGACGDCHDEIAEAKATGAHAVVQCEVCHNTLSTHVKDDEKIADMVIDRSYRLCARCHQQLKARPAGMVQINLAEHLELEPEQAIPPEACVECHDADAIHSP